MGDLEAIIGNRSVVIYGLSTETERVLSEWNGRYNVIGLLDGFRADGEMYGMPIRPIENIVCLENIVIIVVARPGSCRAIMKRIAGICIDNNVEVYDNRGKNLLQNDEVKYTFNHIEAYTENELLQKAMEADVVSFDLFDTLIMRKVMYPTTVIELLEYKLQQRGIIIADFYEKRIKAEKTLSRGAAPKLVKIYEKVLEDDCSCEMTPEELTQLEYETDLELVIPRRKMVLMFRRLQELQKKVYITSDCYYSREQMEGILKICQIENYNGLFVSCEYGTGKTNDLFEYLKAESGTADILHIGDDNVADFEAANKHGIKSFRIYNALEMLDQMGGLGISQSDTTLENRVKIGLVLAQIYNDPFLFEDKKKMLGISDARNLGYLLFAPMILDFSVWFKKKVEQNNIRNIWLGARDGYLIQKILKLLYPEIETEYFLTSRTAVIRAGVAEEKDIEYVSSMKFSGSLKEAMSRRFGITVEELLHPDENADGFLKYRDQILQRAEKCRANYRKYISTFRKEEGEIAFFDFVAKGTCQLYLQKVINDRMKGLYFLQLEPEYMKKHGLNIESYYSNEERDNSAIFENYYILETLLTSPHPSVDEFDENGSAVYTKETRTARDISCILNIQQGILEYTTDFLSIYSADRIVGDKNLDEILLMLIHKINIGAEDFLGLQIEDPFFNRMTDIRDVL